MTEHYATTNCFDNGLVDIACKPHAIFEILAFATYITRENEFSDPVGEGITRQCARSTLLGTRRAEKELVLHTPCQNPNERPKLSAASC